MKKVFAVIAVFLALTLVAGCEGAKKAGPDQIKAENKESNVSTQAASSDKDQNDSSGTDDKTDKSESGASGNSADLSDYPKDIVPLYEMENVLEAYKMDDVKGYHVAFASKASNTDAAKFYKDLFEKAEAKQINESKDITAIIGSLKGMYCMVAVTKKDDGKKCNIVVQIQKEKF